MITKVFSRWAENFETLQPGMALGELVFRLLLHDGPDFKPARPFTQNLLRLKFGSEDEHKGERP